MDLKAIRCSCCGGIEIEVSKNKKLGTCLHCGATLIMPRPDEEIIGLLNTAYLQRANYDFDAAIKTYEFAIEKDGNEKSAYEGLLLAKFGIEYVKDPRTGKLVPTCHRTHFNSIYEDDAYLVLNELCDEEEKEALAKKVAEIDKLQKAIAKQLEKEEDFDIFISYKSNDEKGEKSEDSIIARNIYDKLTAQNYKVFLAEKTLEDRLGSDYEPIIFKAIHTSKIFILVGTKKENINSVWVKNEWTRFIDRIKTDNELSAQSFIPVFKDMSPYDMPKVNNKFVQGVDASKLGYDITVADGISKLLKPKDAKDILKSFSNYEVYSEIKRAEKQAKIDKKKKQINKLKESKLKYGIFLTLEVLCYILPVVMFILACTQKFPFPQYANFWLFILFSFVWAISFIFICLYRVKTKTIIYSPICFGLIFLLSLIFNFGVPVIPRIFYNTYWEITSCSGVFCGGYYRKSNGVIVDLYGVNPNNGSDFIVPEYIDDIKVCLSGLSFMDYNSNSHLNNVYINNNLIDDSYTFYISSFACNLVEIMGDKKESLNIGSGRINTNIDSEIGVLNLKLSGDKKVNIKTANTVCFKETFGFGNAYIEKVSNIKFDERVSLGNLEIYGENEKVIVDFGSYDFNSTQINNLLFKNTKEIDLSSYCLQPIEIQVMKIGDKVEKITISDKVSVGIIHFEGSEQDWNLVNKTIPGGITVLFNQSI